MTSWPLAKVRPDGVRGAFWLKGGLGATSHYSPHFILHHISAGPSSAKCNRPKSRKGGRARLNR